MEQVFFINPVAGKRDASAELVPQIQAAARQLQLPQPQIVVHIPFIIYFICYNNIIIYYSPRF